MMSDSERILFITTEYGENVKGGLGRVVNGIVPFITERAGIDVLLLHYKLWFCKASCYRNYGKREVKIMESSYMSVVKRLFGITRYKAVQFFVPGPSVVKIIKYIKKNYPETKLIYSCHSVGAFEKDIRNTYKRIINSESFIINNVSTIQVLNKASFDIITNQFPDIEPKVDFHIIPNGINKLEYQQTDPYLTSTLETSAGTSFRNVVCISRWAHGKGLEYLLDAVPLVLKEVNDVRFIIAGRKEKSWENRVTEYVKMIDQKIEKLKAQNTQVKVLGWVNDKERNSLIAKTDIWIMPSLLEYFPYALLEPMITQKPIVSSRFPGVEEIIENNKEGLLYNPNEPEELAEKVVFLLKNKEESERLAKNAGIKAETVFNWNEITDMYLKMYN